MARNPYTDEEKDGPAPDDVEHLGGTPGGGLSAASAPGSTALGMSASGNAATAQPKHDRQDNFVSWDRLFDANAGNANRTSEAILGKVNGDVKTSQDAFGTLATNGATATSQHYTPITVTPPPAVAPAPQPAPGVEDTATDISMWLTGHPSKTTMATREAPTGATVSGGGYTGATDISSVDGYEAARASVAPVANDMDVLHNRRTGNIMSLLGQNTPGGNSRMDNALVNRSGGDRFDATYGQYGNYADTAMDAANTAFAAQRAGGESEAQTALDTATKTTTDKNAADKAAFDKAEADRQAEMQARIAKKKAAHVPHKKDWIEKGFGFLK